MQGRIKLAAGLAAAALLGAAAGAARGAPGYAFDTNPGRLPKTVVPRAYTLALEPDAAAGTLRGRETVELEVRTATAQLVFNSLNEVLDHVLFDGRPVQSVASDDAAQLTTVTLAAPARPGRHRLAFTYSGRIETAPQGLFLQTYAGAGGAAGQLLTTQFEATDARRMFPCWDEPAFRATFELTVTVPAQAVALSNMPVASRVVQGAKATVRFARTPAMAPYLVEFTAGDLAQLSARSGATRLGVWTVHGREREGAVALQNAQRILADYNAYFAYPYPLPKLDAIAVPGGFSGAMENWGAITYNDQLLLLGPASTLADRQAVFSTQAHEMAHQWFGDLVTMGWWDNLWLNESFASWMAARETDLRNPDWNWWQAQDASKESAMSADARPSAHAVQQAVEDELQARNAVDPQITYDKGQAVLRMFEAYLGPDVFRDGVRRYLKDRARGNANAADLWTALAAASGRDVAAIAQDWIVTPGFPLVRVSAECAADGARTLRLAQQRFVLQGDPGGARWQVPLQVRSGAQGAARAVLLEQDGQRVAGGRCGEPLSVNAGAIGYYRSLYDPATLDAITQAFGRLPDGDRIALLDDQWALVRAGAQELPSYFALVARLGEDLNVRAWEQVTEALATIERDERGSAGHDAYAAYARSLLQPLAARLGPDARPQETPGVQRLRRQALTALGVWGDAQVIELMRRRFAAFAADRKAVAPDDQDMVLSVVARHADAATFEQMHAIARSARDENELRRWFGALAEVHDPRLAEQTVQIALSDEIPPQAAQLCIQLVAQLSAENPEVSWRAFTGNVDRLLAAMPMMAPMIIAQYGPEIYWKAVPLDELEAWVRAHVPAEMAPNVARGMEAARSRLAQRAQMVQAADRYLAAQHAAAR